MKALILAAGMGDRLRPITDTVPKVMVPLNGKPCLLYAIENLKSQGIDEIAVNTHYMADKIRDYFKDGKEFGVKITYSFERNILGTAGSLNNFRNYFDETFAVVYGDVIANFEVDKITSVHKRNGAKGTIFLDSERPALGKGIAEVDGERIVGFLEKPEVPPETPLINSGFYILEPSVLDMIPKGLSDFGKDILPRILKEGRLFYSMHEGYIFDIGTMEDLKRADYFLRNRRS